MPIDQGLEKLNGSAAETSRSNCIKSILLKNLLAMTKGLSPKAFSPIVHSLPEMAFNVTDLTDLAGGERL